MPGARVRTSQLTAPTRASRMSTSDSVTAPVFVTANVYGWRSPAPMRPSPSTSVGVPAVLTRTSVAVGSVGVRVPEAFEMMAAPRGSVAVAVAELTTAPASTSACVMAYVAVQEVLAPGVSVLVGQTADLTLASEMPTPVRVRVPVFARAKRYVIRSPASTWPSRSTSTGASADLTRASRPSAVVGVLVVSVGATTRVPPVSATADMDDALVPMDGRTLYIPNKYYKALKLCPEYVALEGAGTQGARQGPGREFDGMVVKKVPSVYLPTGVYFMIIHKASAISPVKLSDYRIQSDPVGISGNVVEGRSPSTTRS